MHPFFHSSLVKKTAFGALLLIILSLSLNAYQLARRPISTAPLEQEVNQLQNEVDGLKSQLSDEQSKFQIESHIRNELHMQKEGEIVLQVGIPAASATPTSIEKKVEKPIYLQWWELIVGKKE